MEKEEEQKMPEDNDFVKKIESPDGRYIYYIGIIDILTSFT